MGAVIGVLGTNWAFNEILLLEGEGVTEGDG
jgi:hypothetical protein